MDDLPFFDSFDHLALGDLTKKWNNIDTSALTIDTCRTNNGAKFGNNTNGREYGKNLIKSFATRSTVAVGFAFKEDTFDPPGSASALTWVCMISNYPGFYFDTSAQVVFRVLEGGLWDIIIHNGGMATLYCGETSDFGIHEGIWSYIECKAYLYFSGASWYIDTEIRINEVLAFSHTTTIGWIPTVQGFNWFSLGSSYMDFDDVYANESYLGDIKISVIRPELDNSVTWSRSGGTTNYENVDDLTPDGDSTYIYTATTDQTDLYDMEDPNLTGEIIGLQTNIIAKKDDSGSALVKAAFEIDSVEYYGSDLAPDYSNYADLREAFLLNPATDAQWTPGEVDALIAGVKRSG